MGNRPDRLPPNEAFEQLAGISLAEHSIDSVMEVVARLIKGTVAGVDDVSVTLLEGGKVHSVAFTGPLSRELDERQYERGYGPCLDAVHAGEPMRIESMSSEQRWADWVADARRHGAGSVLSYPVPLQPEASAAMNMYSTEERAFDDHTVELAASFAAYAGVALANVHMYEAKGKLAGQLHAAMTSRAVIEQAKGILMGERRCDADEAFSILVGLSQDTNRKLRDVAQALVDGAGSH